MNCTEKEKGIRSGKRIHRRIETHGAENQFDVGVDPYSRNVKYLSCRILSGEQTIRVIAGAVGYFYFPTAPTSLYSLAISGGIIREHVTKSLSSDHTEPFAVCHKKVGRKKEWGVFFYAFFQANRDATVSGPIAGFPRSDR